ncbi:inner nuclear membrane protein Man1-like [Arapaima gigas]
MAAAQLTDEELYSELKRFGFVPGPVTENTRPVYLKKLKKLLEDQQQRGARSAKGRNSGINNSSNSAAVAGAAGLGAAPARGDVTPPSCASSPAGRVALSAKPSVPAGKGALGFSSDESDVEVNQKKRGLQPGAKRDRGSSVQQHQSGPNVTVRRKQATGVGSDSGKSSLGPLGGRIGGIGAPWWGDTAGRAYEDGREDGEEGGHEVDTESRSVNGGGSPFGLNRGTSAGRYSDSEEEEEEEEEGHRDRRPSYRRGPFKSPPSHPLRSARGAENGQEAPGGGAFALDDSPGAGGPDAAGKRGLGEPSEEAVRRTADWSGSTLGFVMRNRSYAGTSNSVSDIMEDSNRDCGSGSSSHSNHHAGVGAEGNGARWDLGVRPRYALHRSLPVIHSNHTGSNRSYNSLSPLPKPAVPEDELLQQFRRDEVSAGGRFSAHSLSTVLLTAACLFFVLLGLVYLRMRGGGAAQTDAVVKNHPFGVEFDEAYNEREKDTILKLLLHLHDHLANIAGEHDCGDHVEHLNRSLSYMEASEFLMHQDANYQEFVATALEWLIRTEEDVGIRLIGSHPEEAVMDVSEITHLESTHPRMSFICRFRRAFFMVIYRALLLIAGVGIVCSVLLYMKYRWRKEEKQTRQMYDMVEKIIGVLKSHSNACQENKDLQPYLPIPHVRDSLVKPQDRSKMKKVWDQAVAFVSANESRIQTETQRIKGADFLVWRWIQPSLSCDQISSIPSKVWQGKAFPLDRRNSPPNSLTPCLKIRNMFDPVMEVGDNWHLAIHEAILEKCSDNDGIVHIAVDKNSREGCVYVKCLSAEHSGKAFKALHGSWFDGKLVTVKYLRLDRYHQRFPQATGCVIPLKPSSKDMSSLSHLRQWPSTDSLLGFS